MPVIEVSDSTFGRLQKLARPFLDTTPELVIISLIEKAEQKPFALAKGGVEVGDNGELVRRFTYRELPNVKHSKFIQLAVNQQEIPAKGWNEAVHYMLRQAFYKYRRLRILKEKYSANLIEGKVMADGFKPVDAVPFSFQQVDANRALKIIGEISRDLGMRTEVSFRWREKADAEDPGRRALAVLGG